MFCPSCGQARLEADHFCTKCGAPFTSMPNPAPPVSTGGGAAAAPAPLPSLSFSGYAAHPSGYVGIGFWPRAGARIIDVVIHYIVYFFAAFFFAFMLGLIAAMNHVPVQPLIDKMGSFSLAAFALAWLGSVMYHTVCESGSGASLGKLAIGAVVLQDDGTPCRPKGAFIRSLSYFVDALFFGIVGYLEMNKSPLQQRHGDAWGHTMVIRREQAPASSQPTGGRFFAFFVLGCVADAVTAILGLALKFL